MITDYETNHLIADGIFPVPRIYKNYRATVKQDRIEKG